MFMSVTQNSLVLLAASAAAELDSILGPPKNFNFWGERRHKLPVYLAERYKPLHTCCRTRTLQAA